MKYDSFFAIRSNTKILCGFSNKCSFNSTSALLTMVLRFSLPALSVLFILPVATFTAPSLLRRDNLMACCVLAAALFAFAV